MATLDDIRTELARRLSPGELFDRAERCRQALEQIDRTPDPKGWARTQVLLAGRLSQIRSKERPHCLEHAIEAYRKALEVFTPQDDLAEFVPAAGNLALAYRDRPLGVRKENLGLALKYFGPILEIFSLEGMSLEWAQTKANMGLVYRDLAGLENRSENLGRAIEGFQAALKVFQRDKNPQQWAWATMLLGGAYDMRAQGSQREDVEEAIRCFKAALAVYETTPGRQADRATTQMNLGNAYQHRALGLPADNFELAIRNYLDALTSFTTDRNRLSWSQTKMNLGNAYRRRIREDPTANLESAIQAHQEALAALTEEDRPDWAVTLLNLGDDYLLRRLHSKVENLNLAEDAYGKALKALRREEEPRRWAMAQMNLATVYSQKGNAENTKLAMQCYNDALGVLQPDQDPEKWIQAKFNLGSAYLHDFSPERNQSVESAIATYGDVLVQLKREERPAEWAITQNNLATAYRARAAGDPKDNLRLAVEYFRKALEIYTAEAWPRQHMQTQRGLADLFFAERRWREAADSFQEVMLTHRRLYRAASTLEARQTELRDVRYVPSALAYALAQEGDLRAALLAIEEGRARSLAELLALEEAPLDKLRPEDRVAFEEVREQIRQLLAEERLPEETPSRRSFLALSGELARAYAELDAITGRVQGYLPEFLPSARFEDVAAAAADCPLVYLLATEAGGLGLVAQGKSGEDLASFWMPELTEENLRRRLRAYAAGYSAWQASPRETEKQKGWLEALDEALKWLWDAVMSPAVAALGDGGRATLVPTGPLGLLPLHAAWTPARGKATKRRYALDAVAFRYAPSARALLPALPSASRLTPSALLAVDEPLPVSAGRLPNSADEVRSVAAHFPSSRVLSHEAATHPALLAEMKNYPVLHFSCHGLARLMDPLSSGLVMAHDEMLSLRDLLDLRLQSTRLAVLSACETGLPGAELPDEVVSLPAGLLQAGATGVIASLWSVSDISTAILMVRCYELWRKKQKEPMEALRLAQQWLTSTADKMKLAAWYERKYEASGRTDQEALGWMDHYRKNPASRPFQHPYFWAGFFFTGA